MIDIKFTSDGDIDVSASSLWTEPTQQHQMDILRAAQGQYKLSPEVGVDSQNFMFDHDPGHYLRTVRQQFVRDGMKVSSIGIDENGYLTIEAAYENN